MDLVENAMTKKVVTCASTNTILKVRRLMITHHISRVVITDVNNKPTGIITQEDVVNFLLSDKSKRAMEEIRAEEVMSRNLVTAKPDTSISDVAKTMLKKEISSLVIVNDEGKLEGIVTKTDITNCCMYRKGIYKVQDFMTPDPIAVTPSQSVFLVAALLSEHKISRVVVIDKKKKPVGIITLTDMTLLSKLLRPAQVVKEGKPVVLKGRVALPKLVHLLSAGDIMTPDPVSINKDSDLADAARLMEKHGISGLPVTDNEKLVGIITKSDIVRAVASKE